MKVEIFRCWYKDYLAIKCLTEIENCTKNFKICDCKQNTNNL